MTTELSANEIRKTCDPSVFHCDSTEELEPIKGIVGQDRALKSLQFGLSIPKRGFNIFVSGSVGTGRTTAVKSFLEALAGQKEPPSDWCYVHNFRDSYCPQALELPTGMGNGFQKDMARTVDNVRRGLAQTFSSKEHSQRRAEITEEQEKRRESAINAISEKAKEQGFLLKTTPMGLVFMPTKKGGEPMSQEDYHKLSQEDREKLDKKQEELTRELKEQIARFKSEERTTAERLEETDREVAAYAVGHLFQQLRDKYSGLQKIVDYLNEIEKDVIENFEQFKPQEKPSESGPIAALEEAERKRIFSKYEVNVLVDNSELSGAPVILELNPTFHNLIGRMEKESQFGALITDFTMIKSGSLHRANGGYLVLRIEDILTNFQSWQGLKRTLRDGEITIEEIGERLGFLATKSMRPEPVPLNIKVVVVGEPIFYHLLWRFDLEFKELFKVKADFDTRMEKEGNLDKYAAVICRICQEEDLKHLAGDGLAKLVEHSSRLAGDQQKLSALFADIADIIREASFWAVDEESALIGARHVERAIEEKVYRSNIIQQRVNEMIDNGTILIDIDGDKVGQVNGIEVLDLGDFAFGKPARITASVGVGKEGLVDIEREAKLGGRLHNKGVMILGGYLTDKYSGSVPLSLSARLVFEQSYEDVEGDSASSTELYALLSRLANLPVKQAVAVTGSVNQKGEVQAIGGVNEKIEGFFEVCKAKGINGKQGVLIPRANVRNLMVKEEVVQAVREDKFHIYPVGHIEEGIEVLTGLKSGKRRKDGTFEPDTVNDRVQKRITALAARLRDFTKEEEKPG